MKREEFIQQLVLKLVSKKFQNTDELIESATEIADKVFNQDKDIIYKYPISHVPTIVNEEYDKNTGFHNISLAHLNNIQIEDIENIFNSWIGECEEEHNAEKSDKCANTTVQQHTQDRLEYNATGIGKLYSQSQSVTVGCWYIYNNFTCKLNKKIPLSGFKYQLEFESVDGLSFTIDSNEVSKLHKWTLADACDGDFLHYDNTLTSGVMVYKEKDSNDYILNKYCSLNSHGFEYGSYIILNEGYVCPATYTEHNKLVQAMTDNDFEWNSQNHTLETNSLSVGDWVCNDCGSTLYITGIDSNGYDVYICTNNSKWYMGTDKMKSSYHKWTLSDAKKGDILTDGLNNIFIFNEITKNGAIRTFCSTHYKEFIPEATEIASKHIKPAMNQMQELFFSLMDESGYSWDNKNNKLSKIKIEDDVYVPFEIAKMLSKYDFFKNACNNMYYETNEPYACSKHINVNEDFMNTHIPCPTLDKVLLWFRKQLKKLIIVEYDKGYLLKYKWVCVSLEYNSRVSDGNRYSSFETACNCAIKYTLENLIEE